MAVVVDQELLDNLYHVFGARYPSTKGTLGMVAPMDIPDSGDAQPDPPSLPVDPLVKDYKAIRRKLEWWFTEAIATDPGEQDRLIAMIHQRKAAEDKILWRQ